MDLPEPDRHEVGSDVDAALRISELEGQAAEAAVAEDFAKALGLFNQVLELDEDSETALYGRAFCLRKAGRIDEAELAQHEAASRHPESTRIVLERGHIEAARQQWDASIEAFDEGLALDPESANAWRFKARSLRLKGDPEAAAAVLEDAEARLPGNVDLKTERGMLEYDRDGYDAAVEAFDEVLALDPESVTAWRYKAASLRLNGDPEAAESVLEAAAAWLPGNADLEAERGLLEYDRDRYDAAIEAFDEALAVDPGLADAWRYKAASLRLKGDLDAAESALDDAEARLPGNVELKVERGLLEYDRRRYDAAIAVFDEVLALVPGSVTAWRYKAASLRMNGDADAAETVLEDAVARLPRSVDLKVERGLLEYDRDRYDAAIVAFDDALALDPRSATAWRYKAASVRLTGDLKAAAEVLDDATRNGIARDALSAEPALLAYDRRLYDDAIAAFDELLGRDPTSLTAWQYRAISQRLKGQWDAAERALDEADEHVPDSAALRSERGELLLDQGDFEGALAAFRRALELDPSSQLPCIGIARTFEAQGDLVSAADVLVEAMQRAPAGEQAQLLYHQAWVQVDRGESDDAVESFVRWSELRAEAGTDAAETFWLAGNGFDSAGRVQLALGAYRCALAAEPDHAFTRHNIANLLWRDGQYRAGKEAWDEAVAAYRSGAENARSRGDADHFAYFASVLKDIYGDREGAEDAIAESLRLDRNNVLALQGLLDLCREATRVNAMEEERSAATRARTWSRILHAAPRGKLAQDEAGADAAEDPTTLREMVAHMPAHDGKHDQRWRADEAANRLERQLTRRSIDALIPEDLADLGEMYLLTEDHRKAASVFRTALQKPSRAEVRTRLEKGLGVANVRNQRYAAAVDHFEAALSLTESDLAARLNLAEALFKCDRLPDAEAEYKRVLARASGHVESHIGLGEVYTAMGDVEQDSDFYELADHEFSLALELADSGFASKQLKGTERAAVLYSRGYVRIALYEASRPLNSEQLIRKARRDFANCHKLDPTNHKAVRSLAKLAHRRGPGSPQWFAERVGPLLIAGLAVALFAFVQLARFTTVLDTTISATEYGLLTLGALLFMVAGLYLPHIVKLKVGAVELEKNVVEQISAPSGLGVKK